jgi:mannose/fructose/N-acetylgalactosamine-specific phosphotransferase system component IIB
LPAGRGFLLVRVDDRLLHGQVALGWGSDLDPSTYVLIDDKLSGDPLEAGLYEAAVPDGARLAVYSVAAFLEEWAQGAAWDRAVLLVRDLDSLERLASGGFRPQEVNLGGLHARAGAREVLPYLFLSPDDWLVLGRLMSEGIDFFAQDLPSKRRYAGDWLRRQAPAGG